MDYRKNLRFARVWGFCPYNAGANSELRVGPELKRLMVQVQYRCEFRVPHYRF